MSLESLRVWAEGTIQTAMHASYPAVRIKFDNSPFQQPDLIWTAFCILDGKSVAVNLGTLKVDRHVGLVQFDVLAPQNSGTSYANQIAEFGGKQFREKKVSLSDGAVVVFKTPAFRHMGTSGGFYRICVSVNYWRDEPAQ
jgi:hypothetical protein